jgi:hypothetical protein
VNFPEAIPVCKSAMVISSNSNDLITGIAGGQVESAGAAARVGKTAALTPARALVCKKRRRGNEPKAAPLLLLNPILPSWMLVPSDREL